MFHRPGLTASQHKALATHLRYFLTHSLKLNLFLKHNTTIIIIYYYHNNNNNDSDVSRDSWWDKKKVENHCILIDRLYRVNERLRVKIKHAFSWRPIEGRQLDSVPKMNPYYPISKRPVERTDILTNYFHNRGELTNGLHRAGPFEQETWISCLPLAHLLSMLLSNRHQGGWCLKTTIVVTVTLVVWWFCSDHNVIFKWSVCGSNSCFDTR